MRYYMVAMIYHFTCSDVIIHEQRSSHYPKYDMKHHLITCRRPEQNND